MAASAGSAPRFRERYTVNSSIPDCSGGDWTSPDGSGFCVADVIMEKQVELKEDLVGGVKFSGVFLGEMIKCF